jgi:hypothetical protein
VRRGVKTQICVPGKAFQGTLYGVSERDIYINMGVTVEYNDNDYDLYPTSDIHSIHASREEAEEARSALACAVSQGWQIEDISAGCMKDSDTVEEAVLLYASISQVSVAAADEESGEQLYALLAPSGAEAGEWGAGWTAAKCWGVCRHEDTLVLAGLVRGTLREMALKVCNLKEEGGWMMQHLSEMMRLHPIELPERAS